MRKVGRIKHLDFVQGITAVAHQDARLELEGKAKRLVERAV
jgi:hypothetical protein